MRLLATLTDVINPFSNNICFAVHIHHGAAEKWNSTYIVKSSIFRSRQLSPNIASSVSDKIGWSTQPDRKKSLLWHGEGQIDNSIAC